MNPLPAGWKQAALRHVGRITNGATPSASEPEFWGGDIPWATPEDLGRLRGRDLAVTDRLITEAGYRSCGTSLVPPGSIVLSTRAPIGHLAIARQSMCFNQGCRAITLKADHLPEFFFYYMSAIRDDLASYGQGSTFRELSRDKLAAVRVRIPPRDQQVLIAEFLDRETARIDALVEKQDAFIALLDEQRRAIISDAVTGGLGRREAHHSDAGAALASLPTGWVVKRLKHLAAEVTVGVVVTPSKYYADSGVPALRSLNIRPMEIVRDDLVFFDEASNRLLAKSMIQTGDLVAIRTGKPGTTAVVGPDLDGANCIDLILIRRSPRFNSRFMAYVMNSDLAHAQYAEGSEGALQQHFNIETAKNLLVPAPPLPEQEAIAAQLDTRLARHDALRARAVEMIERLREHRAALITAAVTGGIQAAVSLTPNSNCVSSRAA